MALNLVRLVSRWSYGICLGLALALAGIVDAQASSSPGQRIGSAQNVADAPGGFQSGHKVASDAGGAFVAVWENNTTGTAGGWQIFGRCFDSSGNPRANAFQISTGANAQRYPAVAMTPDGAFMVVWEDYAASSTSILGHRIRARRYAANCAAVTSALDVSASPANSLLYLRAPAVAMDPSGNALIAWSDSYSVRLARFDSTGTRTPATEIVVDNTSTNRQYSPAVAADGAGHAVVAWNSESGAPVTSTDVYAQAFSVSNIAISVLDARQAVNQTTSDAQNAAAVALTPTGGKFTVAWESFGQDQAGHQQIYARRYTISGATVAAVSPEFRINPSTAGFTWAPALASDLSGNFWTAWQDSDGGGQGAFARWLDASNNLFDTAISLNPSTANSQVLPAVAEDANGDLLAAWSDQGGEGASDDVFASRFSGHTSADLSLLKQVDNATPELGAPITYTLTVANQNGDRTPTGIAAIDTKVGSASAITVADTLPSGVTYTGYSSAGLWSCTLQGLSTVNCQYPSALLPLDSTSVNITATVPSTTGMITNSATVSAGTYDATPGNNTDSVSSDVQVDSRPNDFQLLTQRNVQLSTLITSNTVTISGLGAGVQAALSITGGEYSKNGGGFTNAAGTLQNGDSFTVRVMSAAGYNVKTLATFSIGSSYTDGFAVFTRGPDTTPDSFTVAAVTGANLSTLVVSPTTVTVSGLEPGYAGTPISVTGGEYNKNGTGFTSAAGTVQNGDTVMVRAMSSPNFNTTTVASLKIGSTTATYRVTTRSADQTPDAFSFAPVTGAPPNTLMTAAETVTISGLEPGYANTPISVTGGEYNKNGTGFTSAAGTVQNGDTVRVRTVSSTNFNTTTSASLKIGSTTAAYRVTTRSADQIPDTFSFTPVTGAPLNTLITAPETVTISGLEPGFSASISVANGLQYNKNGTGFTSTTGTVQNGDTVTVRIMSASSHNSVNTGWLNVGPNSAPFRVTTQ